MEKKTAICVLGNTPLGNFLVKKLNKTARVYKELIQHKKIDYIFYLAKEEDRTLLLKTLEVARISRAKFLLVIPKNAITESMGLVLDSSVDGRIVKVPRALFDQPSQDVVGAICEYMFSQETKGGLFILPEHPYAKETQLENPEKRAGSKNPLTPKKVLSFLLIVLILPMLIAGASSFAGILGLFLFKTTFSKGDIETSKFWAGTSGISFTISKSAYEASIARVFLNDLSDVIDAGHDLSQGASHLAKGVQNLSPITMNLLSGNKISYQDVLHSKKELTSAQEYFGKVQLAKNPAEEDIIKTRLVLDRAILFLDVLPDMLGFSAKKTYLVLFQNSMELRATGGFIGSYGLFQFESGKFLGLDIHDVYSADGQLRGHVDPPASIAKHLGQPHWYLRDSNWDPDFSVSANQASWFLDKETNTQVDGVIGIDIFLVQFLLEAIGKVEVPDYQEEITPQTLYEKAQFYAEHDFFPGSTQKQDFLGALSRSILDKITNDKNISFIRVVQALMLAAEEKHILFQFNNPELQKQMKINSVSGQVLAKDDFLMVVDSNVGINKVNYFVKRGINVDTEFSEAGNISKVLTVKYFNESPKDNYKNYVRIITPAKIKLKEVMFEGDVVRNVEIESEQDRTTIGFLTEIPSSSQKTLVVKYELNENIILGQGQTFYKMRFLKQPGTLRDGLTLTIKYTSLIDATVESAENAKVIKSLKTLHVVSDMSKDREFKIKFLSR